MIFTAFCPAAFNMCGPLDVQVGVAGLQSASQTTASDRGYDRSAERYVAIIKHGWEIHCKYGGFSVKYCEIT